VVLQFAVHGTSLTDDAVRGFVVWIPALIIVQALALRQGFLHRFALAALVTGLALIPYLHISAHASGVKVQRVGLEGGVTLANPNNLAAWFGFCAVYCIIVGIETKRNVIRVVSWLIAVGCLYIVGLTVSRSTLLAIAIATIVALRRLLKRGFLPVLCLAILSWIIYTLGLFDQVGAFYAARGTEETGRLVVWPLVLERFFNAPLTGVGMAKVMTYLPGRIGITPHNHFLFIALVSGIIPLAFYMAYWWRAARGAFRAYTERTVDAPFYIPLVLYAFLIGNTTNIILEPWVIVTLSIATAAGAPRRVRRVIVRQIRRVEIAEHAEF
jgi:O-antigen ligase